MVTRLYKAYKHWVNNNPRVIAFLTKKTFQSDLHMNSILLVELIKKMLLPRKVKVDRLPKSISCFILILINSCIISSSLFSISSTFSSIFYCIIVTQVDFSS